MVDTVLVVSLATVGSNELNNLASKIDMFRCLLDVGKDGSA